MTRPELSPSSADKGAPRPGREYLFHLIAALATCVVIVGGLEAYVRLVVDDGMRFDLEMWKYARDVKRVSGDPLIGHEHRPNRDAVLMGVEVKTNADGMRDRDYSIERRPGTLRIMMLGDSLTEGWGVPLEDTFVKRVESMYARTGVDAEVMDAGVGNYNTIQEVEYFLTRGFRYNPDIVVLNFFVNDAEPVPTESPPSFVERICYFCTFIVGRVDTLLRRFSARQDWADYYLGLYGDGTAQGWVDAKQYIKKLADYCRDHEIRLLIVSLPELHDVQHYRFGRITDLVQEAARENGVAFADMLPYLRDQNSASLWVTPEDAHPNAYADSLIAQGIFEALQQFH